MKQGLAIIFDLDGTLLDTELLIRKSFEHAFKQYLPDYKLSEEEYLSFLGPTLQESFSRYFDDQKIIDEIIDCYREYNHSHHEDFVTMYPSVKETLDVLKEKGYPLAVVTSKYSVAAYIGLDLFEITPYFDIVLGCDHVTNVKPNPEGIIKAMQELSCTKAVYVGDNISDILAAKNAHVYSVGVNWTPKGTKEIEELHPDFMLNQMDELIEFVERVNENG